MQRNAKQSKATQIKAKQRNARALRVSPVSGYRYMWHLPIKAQPCKLPQSKAQQSKALQAKQCKAKQSKAKQCKAKQRCISHCLHRCLLQQDKKPYWGCAGFIQISSCIDISIYIHIYTYMYVMYTFCIYTYIYVFCIRLYMIHIYTYIYIYVSAYVHAYGHNRTKRPRCPSTAPYRRTLMSRGFLPRRTTENLSYSARPMCIQDVIGALDRVF